MITSKGLITITSLTRFHFYIIGLFSSFLDSGRWDRSDSMRHVDPGQPSDGAGYELDSRTENVFVGWCCQSKGISRSLSWFHADWCPAWMHWYVFSFFFLSADDAALVTFRWFCSFKGLLTQRCKKKHSCVKNLILNYVVGYEDPNAETLFRLQVLNLERNVYSKPVELPYFVRQQFGVVTPLVSVQEENSVYKIVVSDVCQVYWHPFFCILCSRRVKRRLQ